MNRLVALSEWARPVTSLAAGALSVGAIACFPLYVYYELQDLKASNAELKVGMQRLDAAVNEMKVSNAELKGAMKIGFAEHKAEMMVNQRR